MPTQRVIFFITADVHILDLAGALQAFYEAAYYGQPYDIVYISDRGDNQLRQMIKKHTGRLPSAARK